MELSDQGWKPREVARLLSLVETEKRYYQEIVAAIPAALAVLTKDLVVQAVNRAFRRTLWLEPGQAIDTPLDRVLPIPGLPDAARQVLEGADRVATVFGEVATPAGRRELRITLLAFRGWNGDAEQELVLLADDITNLRGLSIDDIESALLSERLAAQSSRVAALKRLAAKVAHDSNNLLMILGGHCEELLIGLPPESPLRNAVEEILAASRRLASLTEPLLAYTRAPQLQPAPFDLNASIAEGAERLHLHWNSHIEVETQLDPALGMVFADREHIEDVIRVLADCARDAMRGGGRLCISTAPATVVAGDPETGGGLAPGEYAHLAIADSGQPLDPEAIRAMFDPAATAGRNHVLDVAYAVVRESGGELSVSTSAGGNRWQMYLPLAPAPAPPAIEEPRAEAKPPAVLVVEDEPGIRSLMRRILARDGYRVIEAANGEEALVAAAAHQGSIDLLLTDVVMPRMGGRELAERLCPLRPGLKVLYVSGYTSDAAVHSFPEGAGFLQKPFTLEALMAKVREVLAGKPA